MSSSMSAWSALRPLRPVLIAGAAAVAWLSFSAPAADASTQPTQDSLFGGITAPATSGSSSGTENPGLATRALKALGAVAPAAQPDVSTAPALAAPSKAVPSGAPPAPVTAAEYVPSLVGEILAPVEAVTNTLTSSATLPAQVTAPVATLADAAVDRVAKTVSQTVVAPVTEAAPVLAPPFKSISDVVSQAPSLIERVAPVRKVLEEGGSAAEADVVEALPPTPDSGPTGQAGATQSAAPAETAPGYTGIRDRIFSVDSVLIGSSGTAVAARSFLALSSTGGTAARDGTRLDPVLPIPPPGSGSGNGQSSGGPFVSAAWLTSPFEHLQRAGLLPVRGPLQHIPSPIALEPGSSPD